jgi:hypothetical protein
MPNRGEINKPDRASQLRDFSGLRFGNITPTDIDGLIEYKNLGYVIFELKYMNTEIPKGQELALERLTDDLQKSGKTCLCLISNHQTSDCNIPIDAANTIVQRYRYKGKWREGHSILTKDLIKRFFDNIDSF